MFFLERDSTIKAQTKRMHVNLLSANMDHKQEQSINMSELFYNRKKTDTR